ncbi:eukaryotic membrane protein [Ancylostoma duodenale]|uniref:Eukaryotic membrane protein n=1 Tax=Ancylostoma duodenale TaxID=51022 RepID=A0A0C2GDV9_9BILA|nr:eukaryotic membrane protein [Ancylostoma duodenale]
MEEGEEVRLRKLRTDSTRSSEGFTIGSDLEDEPNSSSYRPAKISIAENLTIFYDERESNLPPQSYSFFEYCWSELTRGLSSFQDILDALFWTANEPKTFRSFVRTLCHFAFALSYATIHTFLVLLQATTLNVAFNSHNQALLAIMMSNNFVELKGSVFKKFAKANLFQMACSDVRERFHIIALLFVVMVRNMMAVNWSSEHLREMMPDILMVVGAELLVDWLKHAFITKFNEINAEVYRDFTITIAYDVVRSRDTSAFSDYSDQVRGFLYSSASVTNFVRWKGFSQSQALLVLIR